MLGPSRQGVIAESEWQHLKCIKLATPSGEGGLVRVLGVEGHLTASWLEMQGCEPPGSEERVERVVHLVAPFSHL